MLVLAGTASATFNPPTLDFKTSTSQAGAHPDAELTIINPIGNDDIRSMKLSLPTGFWGSLQSATKCSTFVAGTSSTSSGCLPGSKIGTVHAEALVDESTARLTGDVYMTTAFNVGDPNEDAAGIGIEIHSIVGGIDLGYVRIASRVMVRGNGQGIDTLIENIPNSIDDTAHGHGVTNFHVTKVVADLSSDLTSIHPLLTNPTSCPVTPAQATGKFSSATTYVDGSAVSAAPVNYPVTGCDKVPFNPTVSYTVPDTTTGHTTGLTADITLPVDSGSFSQIVTNLPPAFGPNLPAYGDTNLDRCPSSSAPSPTSTFDPTSCPASAKIGTTTVTTPLLADPLQGNVYLINKSPLPWLGIDINPSISGNPKGVTLHLLGSTSTQSQLDTACDGSQYACQTFITATFQNIPDAPVTEVQLDLNKPDRNNYNNTTTLSSKFLAIAAANDCQPADDLTTVLTSAANSVAQPVKVARAQQINFTGCDPNPIDVTSPAFGSNITTATAPSITINTAGTFDCGINKFQFNSTTCSGTYAPGAQSTIGAKRFFISSSADTVGPEVTRAFAVSAPITTPEAVAPNTSIDSGPTSTTSDTTPTFTFSGTDNVTAPSSLKFQCSVDGSAFLPCPVSNDYTYAALDADATTTHTIKVRAVDAAGNIDLSPASASFTVDVPFSATLTATASDYTARAHPSYDTSISTPSHDDLKSVTINLPDGFFGGLTGVTGLCSIANADAGTCGSGSQIGTVTTTATVDQSTVVISGKVYLTDPREAGDPASMSIIVPAKVGGVDMGNIIVNGLLKVRDHALGIDAAVLSIPDSVTHFNSALGHDETINFDARNLQLHLEDNPAASQPLLVNPSSCGPAAFSATFGSYGSATDTDSAPFQVTGCDQLGFAPKLSASVLDTTTNLPPGNSSSHKSVSATLDATLTANPGDAGITSTSIVLPLPLTINLQKIPPRCESVQFDADACPASTAVGTAAATTPLLGAPLTGSVFLLRAVPPNVTPRLGIALRGPINTNIIAINSFVKKNGQDTTQIQTAIDTLPDVPLSTFNLRIANVVSTINTACDVPANAWAMTGTFNGFNGKTAPVNAPLKFGCNTWKLSGFKAKWKKPNKSTLAFKAQAMGELKPVKKATFTLPKGVTLNKRALAKKLVIKADGKKLKSKCFKAKGKNKVEINFCKKSASKLDVQFKAGTLHIKKKPRSPKLGLTTVDTAGKTGKYTLTPAS